MKSPPPPPWIFCQLGSREHYAIPRLLHRRGRLAALLTDFWAPPGSLWHRLGPAIPARLRERFHPELAEARVLHPGIRRPLFDLRSRALRRTPWETTLRRNAWFQAWHQRRLHALLDRDLRGRPGVFFAFSYAAGDLLRAFRSRGWKTILGQIDPGKLEEDLVAAEAARIGAETGFARPPATYWKSWHTELEAADLVAVNSPWSAEALVRQGVSDKKLRVLPLAYEAPSAPRPREYPPAFTPERPLRVLYLGQIILRKGAHLLLETMAGLPDAPIELSFVGPADLPLPAPADGWPRIVATGPVSRREAAEHYRRADCFILPTLSDGFALTQLEAQATGLPVLASRFCGAVVQDGVNGRIIDPLTPERIREILTWCLDHPRELARLAGASGIDPSFSLTALDQNLVSLETELWP
ncbi:MAG: glycosyltransferase [Puniceicoccaceae bacterium]|nr:MAG: glycosyltransferase [Puniceicoccaceae bacterium]